MYKDISNYLESEDLTIIPHPPYPSDLSPCDFGLFDLIKENLNDHDNSEQLYDAVMDFMNSLNRDEYKKN